MSVVALEFGWAPPALRGFLCCRPMRAHAPGSSRLRAHASERASPARVAAARSVCPPGWKARLRSHHQVQHSCQAHAAAISVRRCPYRHRAMRRRLCGLQHRSAASPLPTSRKQSPRKHSLLAAHPCRSGAAATRRHLASQHYAAAPARDARHCSPAAAAAAASSRACLLLLCRRRSAAAAAAVARWQARPSGPARSDSASECATGTRLRSPSK